MQTFRRAFLLMTLGPWGAVAWAEEPLPLPEPLEPAYCGPMDIGVDAGESDELEAEAGRVRRDGDQVEMSVDVRVRQGTARASAESARIDRGRSRATLEGDVRMSGPGVALEADRMELDYARGRMEATDARYRLSGGGTGRAQRIERSEDGALEAEEASYSTCALESPLWSLRAETIRIDPAEGQGEARGATLRLGPVPVMAMPWVGFPVGDARRSGWLAPELGTSDDLGYSLETPYYLNLAPHYDAVLSARYMGRRGLQVKPSGRYRTRHGGGAVRAEFLSDNETDDDRYLLHWRHAGARLSGWDYRIDYTDVSDRAYLEDFRSGVHGLSATRLRQEASVAWRSPAWTFSAALTGSDPLKDQIERWDRLPKARAKGVVRIPSAGLVLVPAFAVDAFRGDLDALGVQGERYDAGLTLARKIAGAGWQVTPRLQWRHTQYNLKHSDAAEATAREAGEKLERSPSRTLPIYSVDARARFERRLEDGAVQTLEPRLFYLSRPRRDHSDIPMFDSRRMDLDFDTMFRGPRAAGRDRIGAVDLLATGVETRIIDPVSGYQRLRARLGRVWYFRPPPALVHGGEGDHAKSAWAAEIDFRPAPRFQLRSALRYDPGHKGSDTTWASHMIGWNGTDGERFQARYLRRAEPLGEAEKIEQAEASALFPLGQNWHMTFRYRYDLRGDRSLETLSALEYRGCCMTVGIGAWKIRREVGEESESRVMLQVRFHGLAGFGEDVVARTRRELDGELVWPY